MHRFLPFALTAVAFPALAQEVGGWMSFPIADTAKLAASGWHQVGAASVPGWEPMIGDASDALVTFWEGEWNGARVTLRCVTHYLPVPDATVDFCERPAVDPILQDLLGGPQP